MTYSGEPVRKSQRISDFDRFREMMENFGIHSTVWDKRESGGISIIEIFTEYGGSVFQFDSDGDFKEAL